TLRLLVVRIRIVARDAQQHRRNAESQRDLARRPVARRDEVHVLRRQRQRRPVEAPTPLGGSLLVFVIPPAVAALAEDFFAYGSAGSGQNNVAPSPGIGRPVKVASVEEERTQDL